MLARAPRSQTKTAIRRQQQDWLRQVIADTGLSASRIAKLAGVSDTTLTRFLNDDSYEGALTPLTLARIQEITGKAAPGAPTGFAEDAEPWSGDDETASALAALVGGRANAHAMTLRAESLMMVGYRPGDILIVDMAATPRAGDVVCAQIEQGVGARTVFRVYQPPMLVAAGVDPLAARPDLIDGERVRIAGVVTDALRRRDR